MRTWFRGRAPFIALVLLLLGISVFQAFRALESEKSIIASAGGGGMALPLDDSFIYLQYARAIAQGHPFVYTPGNAPSTGSTSLWYPLLLVPPHLIGAGPSAAVAWTFGLGVLFYFLIAFNAWRLATFLGGWPAGAVACALVFASPHVLWGSLSGMEIGFYAAVLLAATDAYARERADARFPTFRWWAFLLAGSRPEGAVLCGVFSLFVFADCWRTGMRGGARRSPAPAVMVLVAAAVPFLVNLLISGSIESTSSQAKSVFAEPHAETRATYLAGMPGIWLQIAKTYLAFLLPARLPDGTNVIPPVFGWISAVGLGFFLLAGRFPRGRWPATSPVAALLVAGIVVGSFPVHWWVHYHRYLQGLFPLVLVATAAGWGRIAGLLPARAPRALLWIGGAVVAAVPLWIAVPPLLREQHDVIVLYGWNCQNILHQQVAVGRWIDANLPRDAVVGINDAGAIAYYGNRSTVDLLGLTSAGYARVYRSGLGCLFEHLRRQERGRTPDFFAVYPEWFPYWPEAGIFGREIFRAHLESNTICAQSDAVIYPATWSGTRPSTVPAEGRPETRGRALVDSIDLAWLEDERGHAWRAEPEASDVLRRYADVDHPDQPSTDGGRLVRGSERFRVRVRPGRDLLVIVRTDAWHPIRLRVTVDGAGAGSWGIGRSGNAWIEPHFLIPGRLLRRERPEIRLERESAGDRENYTPFRYWFLQ